MSLRWDDQRHCLDLGMGDLVLAERLHLERSSAFSSRARMAAGVEVHRQVQAEQAYASEVVLRHRLVVREWTVTLHGRLDGLAEEDGRTVVEEIKSSALPEHLLQQVEHFPAWEKQLKIYLWCLTEAQRPSPVGRLRVVSLVDGFQRLLQVRYDPEVRAEAIALLDEWILERERRNAWMSRRRATPVPFAYPNYRPGQEAVIQAVEAAVYEGKHLLLSAPTGLGKTAAVLHGALLAARQRDLQVVWLTARTPQRYLPFRTLQQVLARGGSELSAVLLAAKEQFCLNEVVDCRPEACRHASFYYKKRQNQDALQRLPSMSDPAVLRVLGVELEMCPHALALDRAEEVDLLIGDYNHFFDPDADIRRLEPSRCVVVVDEAHQLPDRAMSQASPVLDLAVVEAVFQQYDAPEHAALRELAERVMVEIQDAPLRSMGVGDEAEVVVELNRRRWREIGDAFDEVGWDHLRLRPTPGFAALPGGRGATWPDAWLELARVLHRFVRSLETAGEETVILANGKQLRLYCRDPSKLLGPRFGSFAASICLSATLHPVSFFRDRCGMAPDRVRHFVANPVFPPENRLVLTVPNVSTAWKDRQRDRASVTALLQQAIEAVPGNVAVYFSSFQQLEDVAENLDLRGRVLLKQGPSMGEEDRHRLLAALAEPLPAHRVLLGVLGGIFAEGVDLPGALSAVFVVGPSLPPPGLDRGLLQAWHEERYGDGFERTYVLPGMTRVVQAAGRVIRSAEERGAVVLLCQRFTQYLYASYLPADWQLIRSRKPWEQLSAFFAGQTVVEAPKKNRVRKNKGAPSQQIPDDGQPPPVGGTQLSLFGRSSA